MLNNASRQNLKTVTFHKRALSVDYAQEVLLEQLVGTHLACMHYMYMGKFQVVAGTPDMSLPILHLHSWHSQGKRTKVFLFPFLPSFSQLEFVVVKILVASTKHVGPKGLVVLYVVIIITFDFR